VTVVRFPDRARARRDAATIERLLSNANDVYEAHCQLEEKFRETVGALRALERLSNDPAVIAVAKLIRRDYRAISRAFVKLDMKSDERARKEGIAS
jgi:hypothetical protein